jgi:hypothetical protein
MRLTIDKHGSIVGLHDHEYVRWLIKAPPETLTSEQRSEQLRLWTDTNYMQMRMQTLMVEVTEVDYYKQALAELDREFPTEAIEPVKLTLWERILRWIRYCFA